MTCDLTLVCLVALAAGDKAAVLAGRRSTAVGVGAVLHSTAGEVGAVPRSTAGVGEAGRTQGVGAAGRRRAGGWMVSPSGYQPRPSLTFSEKKRK